ncbi:MAG: DNA primase [Hydrotalea flava]|uniref:DNA primase n=1 Tax=Hydrotalea TaxID=1004300 RepID=UPI000942CB88|nr:MULTISPECIES: DNA primase [Hydrotalea]NIM36175.1 DNA primase [Hydrotalea flava]NIM39026.1 DNA primase [Hydrotalea flava]NIN04261.1 DNA primase [Hydrotalea flava]NIN15887.1 DNA primase [Hydrotalea flava]NIO94952.1 DNA primase [Hydrotalea flava]
MITPQTIEQIKNRIDILDVIGDYVKLKKRGANYLGLCPFHNEKTPSFTVSPVKELYKCFGCGKSGNTITFLMEHNKLSYVEALKWLAERYHVPIEETEVSAEQVQQQQTADSLYILNSHAQKFFSNALFHTEEGRQIALSYLYERDFSDAIIEKFQLGYNPSTNHPLSNYLISYQFNPELLLKSGLVVRRNESDWVDNYRNRIIFPIHNNTGKIIGFGARIIGKNDKAPKYINTPENEIYVKSKVLYGIYFARQAIDKADECLLVEGYTDVISLHQAGIENVVASGGTSLTIDQLRNIKKYTNNLTIIYDGDTAGVKAALRGLDMALEEGLNVKLVLIPDNEDPDSYVRQLGSVAFNEFVAANKKDFILFQLELLLKEAGNDVAKKNAVVNQIAESLSKINKVEDFSKQHHYIKQSAALLNVDEAGLYNLINTYKRNEISKAEKKNSFADASTTSTLPSQPNTATEEISLLQQDELQERNLLRALLEHGLKQWDETMTMADFVFQEIENFEIENDLINQTIQEYRQLYEQDKQPDAKTFLYHENNAIRQLVITTTVSPFELSQKWDEKIEGLNITNRDVAHQDILLSVDYFKLRKIKKMFVQNQKDMENASMEEQIRLIEVHKHLKAIERELTQKIGTVILK